jgi:hypothetical protein
MWTGLFTVTLSSFCSRVTSIPSEIAFVFSQFPNNLPLPKPQKSALIIGGSMHILHFAIRVSQISKVPASNLGWEDMYREEESAWFDWVSTTNCPVWKFYNGDNFRHCQCRLLSL